MGPSHKERGGGLASACGDGPRPRKEGRRGAGGEEWASQIGPERRKRGFFPFSVLFIL
jgi:hypothetical protein